MMMRRTFATVLAAARVARCARVDESTADKLRGAFMGALVADALSLATHYEYDAKKIKAYYGSIDRYYAPGEKTGGETHGVGWGARNFHNGNGVGPAKRAGEQTDYGDYSLLVAEHLAATADPPRPFSVEEFLPAWKEALPSWRSWICTQTKQTYQQVARGAPVEALGGNSNAMAFRGAALVAYYDDEDAAAEASRKAMFTHREATALDGGEFFARVAFRVARGLAPRAAVEAVAAESSPFVQKKVAQALAKVDEATDPASPLSKEEFVDDLALTSMARLWDVGKSEPIKVGKASPTEGTLPGSVYFIVKYGEAGLGAAARANAEVGGDSASRAVAIGAVLGAAGGMDSIPSHLGAGSLVEWDRAMELLGKM
eukprot:CAMPEP_0119276594 /NCGR_PEP_ID=MMETSP1329-20130426/15700_1 /TAXON_ID=114041 /ORGANISM="Genus nov. species nov., Strain RCC1024" /LENGTH=371 /DNA_ID=CAMNT_0007277029 /DNA_START=148 /DNA_END=1260 /DNA_ORIENTATION=-